MELPPKYNFKEAEKKWVNSWQESKLYKYKKDSNKKIYSVDTPPPTVSGRMHVGHAFSYSQQDFIVRYKRMKGFNVFYPFGTDDNGLPTERLIEKINSVNSNRMDRLEFIELCQKTIKDIKPDFIQDWKNIGMSCDWDTTYSTIDSHSIKTAQKSFIELYNKHLVYQHDAPSMWCVKCQTPIAQAELDSETLPSLFNDVIFKLKDGGEIIIATTRPELLGACVCIFVHPEDSRYKHLVGHKAIVPLFGQEVEIFADESVDPEKGSGILMICSYGDRFDVDAIARHKLEPQVVFNRDGTLNEKAMKYSGMKIKAAKKQILEDLKEQNLIQEQKQIEHHVNVHDKCKTEVEFLSSKQWFIKILENKKLLLDEGAKVNWYPQSMFVRYKHWIEGLQWDWGISRQRHFGVPFPVWFCQECGKVILAKESQLPIDPIETKPKNSCECGSTKFIPEMDVMDTWATSSVTPQIVLNWANDNGHIDESMEMYPMSLRPQAHDIIRTWAFYTIVKGVYHQHTIPWKDIVISGHIQDPKGRKMSKSLGNVIDPRDILEKYGADAFRFMAAGSKLGEDMPFQEKDVVTGQKTVTKLWNASKFCLMHLKDYDGEKPELQLMDRWLLSKLSKVIQASTESFEKYEYSRTKQETEQFFWKVFCDNYLEIIKDRLYNPDKRGEESRKSAQYTINLALDSYLKLFAPIMPFITEELYQAIHNKSIHTSEWPSLNILDEEAEKIGDKFIEAMIFARQEKTKKQVSLKEPIKILYCDNRLKDVLDDLKAVTKAQKIEFGELKAVF